MKKIFFVLAVLSALVLQSCGDENVSSSLPGFSGRPGEVVMVCTESQFRGELGQTLKKILQGYQYGLPQAEPYFTVIRTDPDNFESIFKTYRNIVLFDIDPNRVSKPDMEIQKNRWARGQKVLLLMGASEEEIELYMQDHQEGIINAINASEISRLYQRNKLLGEKETERKLTEHMQMSMKVQEGMRLAVVDSNMAWLKLERSEFDKGIEAQVSQGILIVTEPYVSKEQFSDSAILRQRDVYLKQYIPGPKEGTYMTTDYKNYPPQPKEISINGQYAKEIRNLWYMENYAMGGPILTEVMLDNVNNRVVYANAYVYAPNFDKREYLREMEAMIKTIKFVPIAKAKN